MKAIVIGGGIGGLTAAIALHKAGIEADVYERTPALREIGAGISIWSNAIHALDELGVADPIRSRGLAELRSSLRTWQGTVLSTNSFDQSSNGLGIVAMHRADLLALLAGEVSPQRLHLDHEFAGFVQDDAGVTAHFSHGEVARGDVLIGADGLRSAVRARMFGDAPPRYAGYTAWRAVTRSTHSQIVSGESWGRGRRFGILQMGDGRVYWYATNNAPEGERDPAGRTKENLLRLFRGWHEPVEELIDSTDASAILRNDIYDRDPLTRWSTNRVTLLGDAAHPMTPNLGQGACQAIEDAVVLAACLARSNRVDSALREYEQRRVPRTNKVVIESRRLGEIAQWENPILCYVRNAAIWATPNKLSERHMASVAVYETLTSPERELFRGRKPA